MKEQQKVQKLKDLKNSLGNRNIGASVLYTSDVKMTKGGRKDPITGQIVPVNPLKDRKVVKQVKACCKINHNYESSVQNRAEKVGGDSDFTASELPWGNWIEGYENILIEHTNKTGEKNVYARIYFNLGFDSENNVTYLVDGRPATEEEVEVIKKYSSKSGSGNSKKQSEHGIAQEEQIVPRTVKVNHLKMLKCGDYSFSE